MLSAFPDSLLSFAVPLLFALLSLQYSILPPCTSKLRSMYAYFTYCTYLLTSDMRNCVCIYTRTRTYLCSSWLRNLFLFSNYCNYSNNQKFLCYQHIVAVRKVFISNNSNSNNSTVSVHAIAYSAITGCRLEEQHTKLVCGLQQVHEKLKKPYCKPVLQ